MYLEKVRRSALLKHGDEIDTVIPGQGTIPSDYILGGSVHGSGTQGELAGPGEIERPGESLLPGQSSGDTGKVTKHKQSQTTFHVEYRHEGEASHRSHYDKETRTIIVNLDHSQITRSLIDGGGIDGKQFKEMAYEITFVEYSIALGREKLNQDEFYSGSDALFDIRETINRVSRWVNQ